MGFFSGRATFTRYRVTGRAGAFGPDQLERLGRHRIGQQRQAAADGVEVGWTAGDHILDTKFDLTKNIVDDTLHFALRVDTPRIPADLLRAYTQIELEALAAENPSGLPSARQKREARARAREQLEHEAKDGRFVRRKAYPVLWDGRAKEVLLGTTVAGAVDRFSTLFQTSFERRLEGIGAGRRAYLLAEPRQQTRAVDDAVLSRFAPGGSVDELAWLTDGSSRDFLGNEFLLWLWYVLDAEGDEVALADDSQAAVMLSHRLVLECPRGQTGRESIQSDGPARLPEARRAIQAGKLPRQAGLTIARHGRQFELTLQAESLDVAGAKFPDLEEEEPRARLEERVELLRHLIETLDLIYDAFGRRRLGATWGKDLAKIQKWLQREERKALPATG